VSRWLARVLALDGNPLRRGSDRAEAWIRVSLLAVFLAVGPMAAVTAGGWVSQQRIAEISARTSQVHPVSAVLLQRAPAPVGLIAAGLEGQVWVPARWKSAGASTRTGEVLVPAALAAVGALAVVAVALLVLLRLVKRFLNWRRLAAWGAAWSAIGPRWTGHRST
jgi:hypothetical protein